MNKEIAEIQQLIQNSALMLEATKAVTNLSTCRYIKYNNKNSDFLENIAIDYRSFLASFGQECHTYETHVLMCTQDIKSQLSIEHYNSIQSCDLSARINHEILDGNFNIHGFPWQTHQHDDVYKYNYLFYTGFYELPLNSTEILLVIEQPVMIFPHQNYICCFDKYTMEQKTALAQAMEGEEITETSKIKNPALRQYYENFRLVD